MFAIRVDDLEVLVGTGGVEPPLSAPRALLLHGAGQDHTVWALQSRSLARRGWTVLAPDLPGHGRSQDNAACDSIEALAQWCVRLLASTETDGERAAESRPLLAVGHSMGACVALTLAANEPERARALMLIGAGARMPVNPGLLEDTEKRPQRAQRFITAFGHGRKSHLGGSESPGVWNLGAALALLERCDPRVLKRDFTACNAWQGEKLLDRVRCSTLVATGDSDRMTPPKAGRELAGRLRQARFESVAGAGHMTMAEAPREITRLLVRFAADSRVSAGESGSVARP